MLINLPINSPARFGLNKQDSSSTLSMDWATELNNVVFNQSGNIASRKGTTRIHSSALTGTVQSIYQYIDNSSNTLLICSADTNIYKVVGSTLTNITGTITTPSSSDWKFVNFNGHCIGAQSGSLLVYITSVSGSFSDITLSGTAQPSSSVNEILPAFGRVWALDEDVLKYSDLLDETAWNSSYSLKEYWGNGGDIGIALAEFNGHLIVFGQKNIIIYDASQGPDNLVKVEVLNNVGCIARDSVQQVGDDLWFLSSSGLKSLSRVIQEKSLPLRDISKNVRDYMLQYTTSYPIKSVVDEREGFYILSFPSAGIAFCFDIKVQLQDGSPRVSTFDTYWSALFSTMSSSLYIGTDGYINTYSGYKDNINSNLSGGDKYEFRFYSPWTDMGFLDPSLSGKQKILKRMSANIFSSAAQTMQFHWFTDFTSSLNRRDVRIFPETNSFQWGIGQWGISPWSSSVNLTKGSTSMSRSAQYFKFGINVDIEGESFSLQFINIQAKIGRSVL